MAPAGRSKRATPRASGLEGVVSTSARPEYAALLWTRCNCCGRRGVGASTQNEGTRASRFLSPQRAGPHFSHLSSGRAGKPLLRDFPIAHGGDPAFPWDHFVWGHPSRVLTRPTECPAIRAGRVETAGPVSRPALDSPPGGRAFRCRGIVVAFLSRQCFPGRDRRCCSVASTMFWARILPRPTVIDVAEIPEIVRPDQLAAAGALHRSGFYLRTPAGSNRLVAVAVAVLVIGSSLPVSATSAEFAAGCSPGCAGVFSPSDGRVQ